MQRGAAPVIASIKFYSGYAMQRYDGDHSSWKSNFGEKDYAGASESVAVNRPVVDAGEADAAIASDLSKIRSSYRA